MCFISIIIPAFNSAAYLPKCLDSCLCQSFTDFEIIVVDDGSVDNTSVVLKRYSLMDKRIKYVCKKNEGLVCARRTGLKFAKGEFVFFIDADDYIECNALQLLYSNSENADVVIGGIRIENSNGIPFALQHSNKFLYDGSCEGMLCNYLSKSIIPSLSGRLIRKELLNGIITPVEMTVGEDIVTNILLLHSHKVKFKLVDEYIYHYVYNTNSMSNMKSPVTLYKRLYFLKWVDSYVHAKYNLTDTKIRQCLSKFVLLEMYAFLRDGGYFKMNSLFCKQIYTTYVSRGTLKELTFWQISFIVLFRYFPLGGLIFRKLFFYIRTLINSHAT